MSLFQQKIEEKIRSFIDPYLGQDWFAAHALKQMEIDHHAVTLNVVLGYPIEKAKHLLVETLQQHLAKTLDGRKLVVNVTSQIEPHAGQRGLKGISQIKNMIAVASGKGGVGKSTVSVNLALALRDEGARVGILDADIYGPSQPMMLGAHDAPEMITNKEKKILLPIVRYGIQSMSIGYLVAANSAMIWRGPMVTTALQQLLNDTQWDNLDYLIIDLPPGTGDIQLTLAQKIPVSGAVIVTTPQDLALLDARRAGEMFRKVNIPVVGLVENMSHHICSACGHIEAIFGEGGGERLAHEMQIETLGSIPLDKIIREQTDAGIPIMVAAPESQIATCYRDIARQVSAKLSLLPKDFSSKFPPIVVKHS